MGCVPYDTAIAGIDQRLADLPAPPDRPAFARARAALDSFAAAIGDTDGEVLHEMVAELGEVIVTGDGVHIAYWPRYRPYVAEPVTVDPRA